MKKGKQERSEKWLRRRAKHRERRQKRSRFFAKYNKIIAACVVAIILLAAGTVLASGVVAVVFDSEKLNLDNVAPSVLEYYKPASKIPRKLIISQMARACGKEFNVFQQASLPIGNGDMGLSIFGETDEETLVFNEKTLWSGGPANGQTDYNGDNFTGVGPDGLTESQRFYAIRDALVAGDEKTANKLFDNMQGGYGDKGAYLAFGNLKLNFGHNHVKNYSRSLDLDNAIARVSYKKGGVRYSREFFANNPSNVIAMELTAEGGALDVGVGFESKQRGSHLLADDGVIRNYGVLDNGLKYFLYIAVTTQGGKVRSDGSKLIVEGAEKINVYMSASTDYKLDFPAYRTGESAAQLEERVTNTVLGAVQKGYSALKSEHIEDYGALYGRVVLNFGGVKPNFSTDKLVRRYPTVFLRKSHRRYLEQLLFNYGRYLLISSSRENSRLPANLQGVWNPSNNAPWQSDYHINVNLQMNYWPAYNTNLSECARPLVEYVDALREPGRITAKTYTASAAELAADLPDEYYGFVAHTECNPYGHTTPGRGGSVRALWSPTAVAWLLQNVYDGYEYSLDKDYLAQIYPIMREAARYFERTMFEYNGRLISAPSYSPEHGPITAGNAYEQSLIWQLLTDCAFAAKTLGVDGDKIALWEDMLSKLNPIEIGSSGQIKEWYDETRLGSMGEFHHRHTSHLLGLFPGDLIDKNVHPEWAKAAAVTLKARGKNTTGWAQGQRINTYARLGDGKNAYLHIKKLFARGIYANLFDAHPPFQIDGNFGYTAGVTEMLMQSNLGYIELLPALPIDWSVGETSGIVARGNFVISMRWSACSLESATIRSIAGATCKLKTHGKKYKIVDGFGNVIVSSFEGYVSFPTEHNAVYHILPLD